MMYRFHEDQQRWMKAGLDERRVPVIRSFESRLFAIVDGDIYQCRMTSGCSWRSHQKSQLPCPWPQASACLPGRSAGYGCRMI
jgi:hypothetical protein